MPSYSTQRVSSVDAERPGLQRVTLESGRRAYVLTQVVGPVEVGDRVVVNTTAVELGLGTGGWDVVHWNLSRDSWSSPGAGHVMKLRYTSLQIDAGVAEERGSVDADLSGVPVVACLLHSQVACVAAVVRNLLPSAGIAYVMTDGGALPLALSDLVASCREAALLDLTVTAGQAFGGEHEAVNVRSALEVARGAGADVVIVGTGPGVVGTNSRYGFSGVEVASVLDLAGRAGALPVLAVRYSDADPRARHRGVSHHVGSVLSLVHEPVVVAVPRRGAGVAGVEVVEVDVPDVAALLQAAGVEVLTMGRGPDEDPGFYAYAGAAGVLAASLSAASS